MRYILTPQKRHTATIIKHKYGIRRNDNKKHAKLFTNDKMSMNTTDGKETVDTSLF